MQSARPQDDDSISHFTRIIELNPLNHEVYLMRALAYKNRFLMTANRNDLDLALHDADKAVTLKECYPKAYLIRSDLCYLASRMGQARKDMHKALELDPAHIPIYIKKMRLYFRLKNFKVLFATANQALQLNPESLKARYYRALACLALGDMDAAYVEAEKMREINPLSKRINEIFYRYYLTQGVSQGNYNEGIQFFTHAIEANPNAAMLYYYRSLLYSENNQNDLASEGLNKAIALLLSVEFYFSRGHQYYHQNKFDNAIEDLGNVLALLKPSNEYYAHFFLGAYEIRALAHDEKNNIYQAACDFSRLKLFYKAFNSENYTNYDAEKYDPLIELVNKRESMQYAGSSEQVRQFNLITSQINHYLAAVGSAETPLPLKQVPQPLTNLLGFFVTKNRGQFKESESCLPQDLIEKVENNSFLVPD